MRRLGFFGLGFVLAFALAVVIHLSWHFALPRTHPYGLGWPQHWLLAAVSFFLVGGLVARVWKERAGAAALGIALLAVFIAQVSLPVLEVALSEGRLGYAGDPVRWRAFFLCVGAGLPALFAAAWALRPRGRVRRAAIAA